MPGRSVPAPDCRPQMAWRPPRRGSAQPRRRHGASGPPGGPCWARPLRWACGGRSAGRRPRGGGRACRRTRCRRSSRRPSRWEAASPSPRCTWTTRTVDRPGIQRLVEQFGALRARGPGPRAHRWALLFEALAARPVEGWRAVVFGSTDASVEAILLAHGAAHVTTVEYTSAARQGGPSLKWPFGVRLSGPPPQHFAFPVLRLRVPVQGVPLHALRLRHRLIPGLCPLLALT
ncbi:unnamed protein product [Prorocentrum cordatum]|uniref:Uncharacterized protein n=1 Tax=Prorocentrum cordatum TaxID=2364126 RepID=A0ABN9QH54_9DINO|nr:unnamed protein product [Polarella glacialis]